MPERSESVEEQAVRDGSAVYSVEAEITTAEDVPSGYKRTEVGVIPEDWDIGCLGDFYEIKSSKRVLQRDWRRYGIPFYRTREVAILGEKGHVNNELHISEELYSVYANKYGVPKPGDVLVTGIGTIGKMYVVPDDRKFYFKDASIIWLKSRQSFDSAYLKQLFETRIIRNQLADASTGTTVDTYTISGANKTAVPVPRITEQRAIATVLGDMDALLEALDRLIAKKRAIKQATMQQLLTGQTRLPGFSGEWETKRLGDLLTVRYGRNQSEAEKLDGRYPILATGGEIGRTDTPLYWRPSVLIGRKGTIDEPKFMDSPFWTVDTLFYTEIHSAANPKFVFYIFTRIPWRAYNEASGVPSLNGKTIEAIQVFVPDIKEQTAIATVLSDLDTEINALERRRDKARQIKQGMMQQLLTGRVRLVAPQTMEPAAC